MKLFLTSSIGGNYIEDGRRIPCALDGSNHFLELLKDVLPLDSKWLIISADPDNEERNDGIKSIFTEAFKISHLSFSKIDVCDRRNENELAEIIYDYDVLLLAGGHVPTQNNFFSRIHLKDLVRHYEGIVIGISAGTMNCADVVYAQPELEGEAIDPEYRRYLKGLDIAKISILPHFQEIRNLTLDGMRILEDISIPDSKTRPFYALVDGAFIFVNDNVSTLYGEAYLVQDGRMTKICETGNTARIMP